jgi:hypothetical protein
MSIVTIIIDENSAQSAIEAAAAAQQALQEINESGLVETVRQPYTTQTNSKGFGNINLRLTSRRYFLRWSNDGLIRISEAKYLGVSLLMLLIFFNSTNRNLINKNYENKILVLLLLAFSSVSIAQTTVANKLK